MLASDDDKEDLARIDELRRKAAAPVPTVTPDGSFGTDEEHTSAADFALERSIGRGAFGEVFLATSKLNGRTYAIKTIPKKQANEERRALLAVKHPFVVRLRWVVHHATDAWLIMDYAPKSTLASHLERRPGRRLPLANARLVSAELASALLALHGAGVVHRDIKPSNVLVDQAGHCLLADLGLAAKTRDPLKRLCGTLEYLAPEQLRGKVYGRSVDLWALGCLTFETLVGYSPFSGARTRAIFQGILRHEPSYFALGDKEAIHLVSGLLKKDVQQRFGMKEDLLGHAYFRSVDRKLLDARRLPAPLGPNALPDVETPDGSKLWTVSSGGSSAPGSRGSSVAAAAPPPQRRNPLDRARYDAASKPRGPPLPPRRNPLLEAAAAPRAAPPALPASTDDDDDHAPPVYRRRSGTLFRHAAAGPLLTPTAPRRGGRAGPGGIQCKNIVVYCGFPTALCRFRTALGGSWSEQNPQSKQGETRGMDARPAAF